MPNKVNSVFFRIPEGVMGYNVKILNYVGEILIFSLSVMNIYVLEFIC